MWENIHINFKGARDTEGAGFTNTLSRVQEQNCMPDDREHYFKTQWCSGYSSETCEQGDQGTATNILYDLVWDGDSSKLPKCYKKLRVQFMK